MTNRMDKIMKWFDDKLHNDGYVYFNDLMKEIGFSVYEPQKYWKYVLDPISGKISFIKDDVGESGHIIDPTVEDFQIERIKL